MIDKIYPTQFVFKWLPDCKKKEELEIQSHLLKGTRHDEAYAYFVKRHFPEALTAFAKAHIEEYAKTSKDNLVNLKVNDPVQIEFSKDFTPAQFVGEWLPDYEKRKDTEYVWCPDNAEYLRYDYFVERFFNEALTTYVKALKERYTKISKGDPVQIKVNDPVLKEFSNNNDQTAFGYVITQKADNYKVQCCCGTYLVKKDDVKKATINDVDNFDLVYQELHTRLSQYKKNQSVVNKNEKEHPVEIFDTLNLNN